MYSKKDARPTKLLWMDLEFTDFDYSNNCVLEVSVEITDFDFKTLARYESLIKNDPDTMVKRFALNTFWQDYPENREHFLSNNDTAKDLKLVEDELVALVQQHFGSEPALLAGNSIHSDRAVIKAHWPRLDLLLHYRMVDVSSLKSLLHGKYGVRYTKKGTHRAGDDVRASIAELQYYLEWLQHRGQ